MGEGEGGEEDGLIFSNDSYKRDFHSDYGVEQ